MNSMNKQVQENTIQSQNEWNACLLFRNKQLTKEGTSFCIGGYGLFCFATTGNVSVVEAAHNSGLWYYKE